MSYNKVREIDQEILNLRDELRAVYAKLRELLALRKYHQDIIKARTEYISNLNHRGTYEIKNKKNTSSYG